MKKIIYLALIGLFSSCAGVKFVDHKGNESEGIKFYNSEPYLLVEYNVSKDLAIKTSIIYLPDLVNPNYMKVKNGLGSSAATLGLTNGMISSFGLTTDSKIPETITAISGLIPAVGIAQQNDKPSWELYKIEKDGTEIKYSRVELKPKTKD